MQQLGGILSTFAARVDDLTSRIPATPPLAAITGDISSRIASSAEQLASAAIPALRTNDPMEDASGKAISTPPDEIFADLLSNANTELELVLKDIQNQKGMVPNLLEGLKAGPLGPLVEGAENTLKQVSSGIDVSAPQEAACELAVHCHAASVFINTLVLYAPVQPCWEFVLGMYLCTTHCQYMAAGFPLRQLVACTCHNSCLQPCHHNLALAQLDQNLHPCLPPSPLARPLAASTTGHCRSAGAAGAHP